MIEHKLRLSRIKLERGCARCGYNQNAGALHFDHIDRTSKLINLSQCTSWARIEEEIQKCVVHCANCHAELTWPHLEKDRLPVVTIRDIPKGRDPVQRRRIKTLLTTGHNTRQALITAGIPVGSVDRALTELCREGLLRGQGGESTHMAIDIYSDIATFRHERALTLDSLRLVEVGKLPNQRTLIIPDPGYSIIDMDLDRADAQFVAWEANDESLKQILKEGKDLHLENAKAIWGDHITEDRPERQLAKRFCHAVNYGAYPKKLAKSLGISLRTAEWIYSRWFAIHPGIRDWHRRVKAQLFEKRLITNPFGFERYYFDRPEKCINEALAWMPQSSVGIIINTAWDNIDANLPEVEVLMQVHDSLTMQAKTDRVLELIPLIQAQSLITVPYSDPLIIPVGFKVSDISWGDAKNPCAYIDKKDPSKGRFNPALYDQLQRGLANAKSTAAH